MEARRRGLDAPSGPSPGIPRFSGTGECSRFRGTGRHALVGRTGIHFAGIRASARRLRETFATAEKPAELACDLDKCAMVRASIKVI